MISTKESARELLGLDKVNQVDYVAISVASRNRSAPGPRASKESETSTSTFKPEKGGLICERLFGPVKDCRLCPKNKRFKHRASFVTLLRGSNPARVRQEPHGAHRLASRFVHIWVLQVHAVRIGLVLA